MQKQSTKEATCLSKNDLLIPLFNSLKEIISPYEEYFTVRKEEVGYYDLWSEKEIEVAGRKRKEVFFVGLIIQKTYVGFYFMPYYTDDEVKKNIKPTLLSMLKGKSCFHIKDADPDLMKDISEALEAGLMVYTDRGWVN